MASQVSTPTESSYSVDNVLKGNFIAPQSPVDQNEALFFETGDIGARNHSLSVIITSVTWNFPYYLDYLAVVPPSPHSSSSSLHLPTTSTSPTISQSRNSSAAPSVVYSHRNRCYCSGRGRRCGWFDGRPRWSVYCRNRKKSGYTHDIDNKGVDIVEGRVIQEIDTTMGNSASIVTPYMPPRDYGTASAPMVPRQTAAPLAPRSISGTPTSVQIRPSLSPFVDPMFQRNGSSPRVFHRSDRNTRLHSALPQGHTGNRNSLDHATSSTNPVHLLKLGASHL
ncbi:hypothetical protein PHLCEN_2v9259 [Hermanssonia centrifuga]|uniref:Uncharacterized protein n=1 Tax=Hermanssonia centrifuga TaxID=98765 RepID=A0A2R6NRA4_9APHY|nr:hypothetical protein PHLCEN_2v9259 [Hermanssonia centrifuga]